MEQHDCFVLILSGHGGNGFFCACKEKDNTKKGNMNDKLQITTIVDMLNNVQCAPLAGKPKIVIIEACRGSKS